MLNPGQFRELVIRPTLQVLDMGGDAAEVLLLGTALVESGLTYMHQVGSGPALGLYQCEPATHGDIWTNYLNNAASVQMLVRRLMTDQAPLQQLVTNLAYATAICRVHYRRVRELMPLANDAPGMAAYHKRFYNSPLGATDVTRSVDHFRLAMRT